LSILEKGIRDPLQGIDIEPSRILLDGFKNSATSKSKGYSKAAAGLLFVIDRN
jgi:hypothetical protein